MAKNRFKVSKVESVNEQLLNWAVLHAVHLERLKSSEEKVVTKFMLSNLIPELKKILRTARSGSFNHTNREFFLARVQAITAVLSRKTSEFFAPRLVQIGQAEAVWQVKNLKRAIPLTISLATPSTQTISSAVLYSPFEGRVMASWFSRLASSLKESIRKEVMVGISLGESVDTITKRIVGINDSGLSSGFKATSVQKLQRNVRSVVRTAISHSANVARDKSFAENSSVIKGVQIVATLDARTTDICKAQDGKIYPVDSGPRPPFHYGCRTVTVPVTKSWKEIGVDAKDMQTGKRASMNGEVAEQLTYGQWLRKQSKELQDEILGPERARLFRSGRIKIEEFVDAGKSLTLEQLALRAKLKQ